MYQRDGEKDKVTESNKKKAPSLKELKQSNRKSRQQKVLNSDLEEEATHIDDKQPNGDSEDEPIEDHISSIIEENDQDEVIENLETEKPVIEEPQENGDDNIGSIDSVVDYINEENNDKRDVQSPIEDIEETVLDTAEEEEDRLSEEVEQETSDDAILNEVLTKSDDNTPRNDEDNILDSILSDDGQNLENSEVNNER